MVTLVKEEKDMKTVRISDETHMRLAELGKYTSTMDDIIRTVLDFWDSKHKDKGTVADTSRFRS